MPKHKAAEEDPIFELCACGYGCRLFPRPEEGLDEEKDFLPLPYDKETLVDRFDARLLLHSSSPSTNTNEEFEEEHALELYHERYRDLDEQFADSDAKRPKLNESEDEPAPSASIEFDLTDKKNPEDSVPFQPSSGLCFPSGMILPKTHSEALTIEKTAYFVDERGRDIEKLLLAKDSTVVDFLKPTHPLNPFYEHVLMAIKDGAHVLFPKSVDVHLSDSDSDDGNYISPLLSKPFKIGPTKKPPTIKKASKVINLKPFYVFNDEATKKYRIWHRTFYGCASPYNDIPIPNVISPAKEKAATIVSIAACVSQAGAEHEKEIATTYSDGSFLAFTHPYYMFYQFKLYETSISVIKQAVKNVVDMIGATNKLMRDTNPG